MSKDVEALVSADADLSEEFKEKAATIFETAVKTRLAEKEKEIQAKSEKEVEEKVSAVKEELVEKVDSYLNYVVEEWIKDNQLAIDRGIKSEISEDFISGLKIRFLLPLNCPPLREFAFTVIGVVVVPTAPSFTGTLSIVTPFPLDCSEIVFTFNSLI